MIKNKHQNSIIPLIIPITIVLTLAIFGLFSCQKKEADQISETISKSNTPVFSLDEQWKQTQSGLKYVDIKQGSGMQAQSGKKCRVHYTGWLTDGSKFDSSHDRGQPFSFVLGQGMVIKGWDEGVEGMKIGGQRKLLIPPHLGYGSRGAGNVIPADAELVFDIELLLCD